MSQAMTKREPIHPLAIRIALNGNLAALNDEEIWLYYQQQCERLGLDPLSRPFDIIETKEGDSVKKVLYPNSSCSSQLAEKRGYSFGRVQIEAEQGMAALGLKVARVSVECSTPQGRKLIAEAFIDLVGKYGPLSGVNLVNALKKAATQARRRGTLQLAGLTLPSEDEHNSIATLGDIEQQIEDSIVDHEPESLPSHFVAGALPLTEIAPEEAPEPQSAIKFPEESKKSNSGNLTGKPAQIRALINSLGWSEDNLLKVINEEFHTEHGAPVWELLTTLTDRELATIIQLLKAEMGKKGRTR